MGSDAKAGYGAKGRGELLRLDPFKVRTANEPGHPRYDPHRNYTISEEFVQDIADHGVIEPVVVNRRGYEKGVPIVDTVVGTRRILHARVVKERQLKAGVPEEDTIQVPAIARNGTEEQLYGVMIAENEHRLDDTMFARAMKCAHYVNTMGKSKEQAARRFGKSLAMIDQWLRFVEVSEAIQQAVREKQITLKIALKIAELPKGEQSKELARLIAEAGGGLHGKKATEKVESEVRKRTGREPRPRMRGRKYLEGMRDKFKSLEEQLDVTKMPPVSQVIAFLLGDDAALSDAWREMIEPAKKAKAKGEKAA